MVTLKTQRPYLLLDAGGTLVYPNPDIVQEAGRNLRCELRPQRLLEAYFESMHRLDVALRDGAGLPTATEYFSTILTMAGATPETAPAVLAEMERLCGRSDGGQWTRTLWTYALPWTRAALEKLYAAGYGMSVVSNSDGNVAHQIADLGLAPYFDEVFDSHWIGAEKPDPRIFRQALERLDLGAPECLFVGDLVMVDVVGANRVGIAAVHLDPLGLYGGWPGFHTKDLETFAEALQSGALDLLDPSLRLYAG
jgi:HAD superfamily hydrolase (TIGR01509 family)